MGKPSYVLARPGEAGAFIIQLGVKKALVRLETPRERAERHWTLQRKLGHWVPDGTRPRLQSSYRAARRNRTLHYFASSTGTN